MVETEPSSLPGSGLLPTAILCSWGSGKCEHGPCPPQSISASQRQPGTGPPPPRSLLETSPDLGFHAGLPLLARDPGLARNPSEPPSGLGWVCVCTRRPFLPLLLGGSLRGLGPPTHPPCQVPLLPCPAAVGQPSTTTTVARGEGTSFASCTPPPPASLGILQRRRLRP